MNHSGGANFSLRDEIKAYWSARSKTFDTQVGHEIFSEAERLAWLRLIEAHLGPADGRAALDLATGTAVVAHLLDEHGFRVTGLDWSEEMLSLARAKAAGRGRTIDFMLGDAEFTTLPDDSFDVIVTRHLVWTLVDPDAAFREWLRVLRPGGRLLLFDGDFVQPTLAGRVARALAALGERLGAGKAQDPLAAELQRTHRSILARLPFADGARGDAVAEKLAAAGFTQIVTDFALGSVLRAQARRMAPLKGLERLTQHRYAISATAP